MTKRGKIEVYRDILQKIGEGTDKPTRLMYRTNVSWTSLQKSLSYLIAHGFVKEEVLSKTPKGRARGSSLDKGVSPTYLRRRYTLTAKGRKTNSQLIALCTELDIEPMVRL